MTTVCVCGAGTMGSGIAQVSAKAGYRTLLFDVRPEAVEAAKNKLHTHLATQVQKGKITEAETTSLLANLQFTADIEQCRADLIIEAIVESTEAKVSLFQQLAAINTEHTLFASNTSSLSISALASALPHPQRVAGLHFFNPAPLMKLVEVVRGQQTTEDVLQQLVAFTKSAGKVPVVCTDAPGFIVNRVVRPYYIESLRLAEEGLPYDLIDRVLQSAGFRMGPFALMDLIGNDVNYAVSCSVFEQLNRPDRLKPSYLQKEKVETGALGKKTAKGYYTYNS